MPLPGLMLMFLPGLAPLPKAPRWPSGPKSRPIACAKFNIPPKSPKSIISGLLARLFL